MMDTLTICYPNKTQPIVSSSTLPPHYKTARATSTIDIALRWLGYAIIDDMKDKPLSFPSPAVTETAISPTRQQTTEDALIDPESAGWLKLAESNFAFWDNESDAYFDSL